MTHPQTAAMTALLERVEAGDRHGLNRTMAEIGHPSDVWPWDWMSRIDAAYLGSLDAAKALHDAVQPDRPCGITFGREYGATVTYAATWDDMHLSVRNIIPARAWLIAILRALIAKT